MDERIYEILNNAEMNLEEYEEERLSEEEQRRVKRVLLQEVRKMEHKEKKKKGMHKTMGIVVAAGLALAVIVAGSNSVVAKSFLSRTFEKMIAGSTDDKDAGELREQYTKIGEESVPAGTGEDASALTVESAGVELAVSDVYCDGYMLYYTMELKTNEPLFTDEAIDGIVAERGEGGEGSKPDVYVVTVDGKEGALSGSFERQEDGSYTTMQSYSLYAAEDSKSYQNGDKIPVEIEVGALTGYDYDRNREDGEYVQTKAVNGDWKLSFEAAVDTSANVTTDVHKEENGVTLVSVTKSKACLNLVVEAPNFGAEPYNDPYNDPDIAIRGENGEPLQWMSGYDDRHEDGSHTYYITVLDNDDANLKLEVTNKNTDGSVIAAMEFQPGR